MNWNGKRVLVCGMARSGFAAARALRRVGAVVTVYDRKEADALDEDVAPLLAAGCRSALGGDPEALCLEAELVVISPGIAYSAPFVQKALAAGIPVIGELELGAMLTRGPLIAITGTNGKTTTTTLVGEFFRAAGKKTYVVGNIGDPITETALDSREEYVTVAEVSSYQCESIDTFHPAVAAVLNISEDHLARHGDMDTYIAMKKRVFRRQTAGDTAVLNADDPACMEMEKGLASRVIWFSRRESVREGACVEDGWVVLKGGAEDVRVIPCAEIRIPGNHNLENALAAVAIAGALHVPASCMRDVLRSFPGVEHRIETVRELDGVVWINDSKGTNVDSTLKAIDAMTRPTVLILGGSDKKVSFAELAKAIKASPLIRHCVLIGDTANQICTALDEVDWHSYTMAGYDFDGCLALCRSLAEPGGCVLLSPACASFDMFRDYEDRGRVFKEKVAAFTGGGAQ